MIAALFRILFGFLLACLAAAIVLVCFVVTPADILASPPGERLAEVGNASLLALLTAIHIAIFSAVFALVAIIIAGFNRIRDWIYYAIAGNAIALVGFMAQYFSESPGSATIVNTYAFIAYALAGFIAGLVYWYVAGRRFGRSQNTERATNPTSRNNRGTALSRRTSARSDESGVKWRTKSDKADKRDVTDKPSQRSIKEDTSAKPEKHEDRNPIVANDIDNDPANDPPPRVLRQDLKSRPATSTPDLDSVEAANDEREPTKKITLQEALDELENLDTDADKSETPDTTVKRDGSNDEV